MGDIALGQVIAGALAFFAVTIAWYRVLFAGAWRRAAGLADGAASPVGQARVLALVFAFALLISLTLAHQYAMTGPSDRAKMMIAIGYGAMLMTPAIGIAYLLLGKSGKLFAIDAGHFIAAMTAMGALYCLMD